MFRWRAGSEIAALGSLEFSKVESREVEHHKTSCCERHKNVGVPRADIWEHCMGTILRQHESGDSGGVWNAEEVTAEINDVIVFSACNTVPNKVVGPSVWSYSMQAL